jgi:hypothetical protein
MTLKGRRSVSNDPIRRSDPFAELMYRNFIRSWMDNHLRYNGSRRQQVILFHTRARTWLICPYERIVTRNFIQRHLYGAVILDQSRRRSDDTSFERVFILSRFFLAAEHWDVSHFNGGILRNFNFSQKDPRGAIWFYWIFIVYNLYETKFLICTFKIRILTIMVSIILSGLYSNCI